MSKVKGADELIKKLRKMNEDIKRQTREVIFDVASDIATQAELNAPTSFKVSAESFNDGFSQRIAVDKGNLAAYVEFGTGMSAAQYVPTLPKEWQAIAKQFYINGKGTLQKRPFLYPAYFKYSPDLVKNLKLVLEKAVK